MNPQELKKLRAWFMKNAAELPWRPLDVNSPRDPYAVWISETMLQQTQVSTVQEYFTRWMKRFPDVKTLAATKENEVFKYWQGLGYYSLAKNILKTAKRVAEDYDGKFPSNRKELEALPGIGAYTAGAILSLAFHKPEAILDGNLVRIFSRYFTLNFLPTDKSYVQSLKVKDVQGLKGKNVRNSENDRQVHRSKSSKSCSELYWEFSRMVADHPKAYLHNEALMELGRRVCKVKNPECEFCPLMGGCRAYSQGAVNQYPPPKAHLQKDWHGTALVVESADGKILAVSTGCPFLNGQLALPHFESSKNATVGIPSQVDSWIDADHIADFRFCKSFKHNITVHKISCEVLYIKLDVNAAANDSTTAKANFTDSTAPLTWIKKAKVFETFANTFSLKALKSAYL